MDVKLLQKQDGKKWNEFVKAHSQGRFIHLSLYKDILEKTYKRFKGYFIYAEENGEVLAILPFFKFQNIFFRNKFVSQPFSEYGGILFKENLINEKRLETIQALKEYLSYFLGEYRNSYLEIRGQLDQPDFVSRHFVKKPLYKVAFLKLDSYQSIYNKFDYQVKKAVKKAEKEGIEVFKDTSLESIKNKFYPLYARYIKKRHGTPPYSLEYFLNCYKYAPENIKIFFAEKDQKIIAALWGFLSDKRIQISYNPSLKEYFLQRPNDFLHAKFIEWGCQNNFQYFDFGSARYPGQINFKKKWGVEFSEYSHFYFSNNLQNIDVRQSKNLFGKTLAWIWKHFVPNHISNLIGPSLRERMGR